MAACALGLLLRARREHASQISWAVGLGASFAALWLTREENMVVVPFLLFAAGAGAYVKWHAGGIRALRAGLLPWIVALGIWAAFVFPVSALNLAHYGVFAKTEFDTRNFKSAYGALSRVKPAVFKPLVPVAKETRRRIYRLSPTFDELRPYIEGVPGSYWESYSESQQDDSNRHEILAGWFAWALRDAVSEAGYYAEGRYPADFYGRLAREVNSACDQHMLECYGPRSTLAPVLHFEYVVDALSAFGPKLADVVGFRDIGLDPIPSVATDEQQVLFRALTGNQLTPTGVFQPEVEAVASDVPSDALPEQRRLATSRSVTLGIILRAYQTLTWPLAVIAILFYGYFTVGVVRTRVLNKTWLVLTALLLLLVARITLVSYLDVTSLRVSPGAYLHEVYPVMLSFAVIAPLAGLSQLGRSVHS
jgi:hypothetical protein